MNEKLDELIKLAGKLYGELKALKENLPLKEATKNRTEADYIKRIVI